MQLVIAIGSPESPTSTTGDPAPESSTAPAPSSAASDPVPSSTTEALPEGEPRRNACQLVAGYDFDPEFFGDVREFTADTEEAAGTVIHSCSGGSESGFVFHVEVATSPQEAAATASAYRGHAQLVDNVTSVWSVGRFVAHLSVDYLPPAVAFAIGLPDAGLNADQTVEELTPIITAGLRRDLW